MYFLLGDWNSRRGIDQLVAVVKALKEDAHYYFHIVGSGSQGEKVS